MCWQLLQGLLGWSERVFRRSFFPQRSLLAHSFGVKEVMGPKSPDKRDLGNHPICCLPDPA